MKGYTLIEILIVLFIVSVVSSIALLSISSNQNKELKTFVNEFSQTLSLVEEQALLQPSVFGLKLNNGNMRFFEFEPAVNEKKNKWKLLADYTHAISSNIELNLEVSGKSVIIDAEKEEQDPPIVISTNGDITPFKLYVGKRDAKPRYLITGDSDGTLTIKDLS